MKKIVRFFYHMSRNLLFNNYEYLRLSPNEAGTVRFYDRKRKNFFSFKSRGFIDSVTANQIYTNNEYNFALVGRADSIRAKYDEILASDQVPLIIDCGANIGLSAQYFAREFPDARIIAVEPDAGNFATAKRNCADFDNIQFVHAAIGSEVGFVAIEDSSVDANAFRVTRTESGGGIRVRTIPDLVAEADGCALFIVKVDIEGFERDMFSTNTDWIARCFMLVVELHDWMLPNQASSGNFIKAIAQYDRDFLFKGESVFSIRND